MRKKVLLLMPNRASIYTMIVQNLEYMGYEVDYFNGDKFAYKNFLQRVENFFRKTFLKQKKFKQQLKMQYRELDFKQEILNKNQKYDYALVIRPDFYGENIPQYLKKICKKTVAYQWDGLSRFEISPRLINTYDTFAVFDENDYKNNKNKYPNLIKLNNFYFDYLPIPNDRIYDFFYIGTIDQEREKVMKSFAQKVYNGSYKGIFKLYDITKKITRNDEKMGIKILHNEIPYDSILEQSSLAKVVLDQKYSMHNGLSLRFFEALHFSQKVITNNESIKSIDFYHPHNHLVFDKVEHLTLEEIKAFMEKPYYHIPTETKEKYSFQNWFKNIIKD